MIIDAWLEEKEQNTQQPQCSTDEYGNKEWKVNGKLHREDGPAYESSLGCKCWYRNGYLHRTDGPAVILPYRKEWWLNGKQVSEEEVMKNTQQPQCIINERGDKVWSVNGKFHRTDGPAWEWANGDESWYQNNEPHRTDGPAIISGEHKEWWVRGVQINEKEFIRSQQYIAAVCA